MSGKEKIVVLNGKRFVVGSGKIKPTKCYSKCHSKSNLDSKNKKTSRKEIGAKRKAEKVFKRKPKTSTRKRRAKSI